MPRQIHVHLLPALFEPAALQGGIAVVIDVLRASTTIVHAFAAGATGIRPCVEVDEARRVVKAFPPGRAVLGGERDGVRIQGFALDNSPLAYTPAKVDDMAVVFTTTNGTRALKRSAEADRILIGAFVNLEAVVREVAEDDRPLHLVCAGTYGQITLEDTLLAGAVACGVQQQTGCDIVPDDCTTMAMTMARSALESDETLHEAIRSSFGGRNCLAAGFAADVERAATRNLFSIVPEYRGNMGMITARVPRRSESDAQ